jgi:hypothetical protein
VESHGKRGGKEDNSGPENQVAGAGKTCAHKLISRETERYILRHNIFNFTKTKTIN